MRLKRLLSKISWPLLVPVSWGYGRVVAFRNRAYNSGRFPIRKVARPVVSIGNLVAGGTGKTPVVQLLAGYLSQFGRVAVLARGYRADAERREKPTFVSRGKGPEVGWREGGDEPCLIAHRVPEAIVVSGRSRWAGAQLSIEEGAQLILLDDGMQHRRLHRDLEVVLIDGRDPFGGHAYLPVGRLRESPSQLRRADLILITHPPENRFALEKRLTALSRAPIVWMEPRVRAIVDLEGRAIEGLQGVSVGLFCGIAKPEGFVQTVWRLGCRIVGTRALADHGEISQEQLVALANKVRHRGGELLLCTEKDWIKLDPGLKLPLPVAVIQIELAPTHPQKEWDQFLKKCEKLVQEGKVER